MPNKKFFISWIVSSIYMYGISFVWHGIILNDLARLTYPKNLFLLLAAIAYMGFGFALAVAINYININKTKISRGLIFGIPLGVFVYLIAFVFGISFNSRPNMMHVAMDLTWQVIEQGTGGLVAGLVFRLVQIQERINKQLIQ
jgi:hypothetical protein